MEAYIDDMIVKSRTDEEHLADLKETFETLSDYKMKLNPKKCTFGVRAGKFLGFMIDQSGIEANPDKVKAVQNMKTPSSLKEVQKLTGCIAALRWFMSRSFEICLPLFELLKKKSKFEWTDYAKAAFEGIKEYLASVPRMVSPFEGEELFMYLAVSEATVNSVLIVEREQV